MIPTDPSRQFRFQFQRETVLVEPWGSDSLRIRITINPEFADEDWALLPPGEADGFEAGAESATHGDLRFGMTPSKKGFHGFLVKRVSDGEVLLEAEPVARLKSVGGDYCRAELRLRAFDGEKLYGLGQHPNGRLDQKGCVIDLHQKNTEVAIPWVTSSRGYGMLWNLPGTGRVELAENLTRWVADSAKQIDLWVTTAATPAGLLASYAEATGHAPRFPDFASGFWQCKLRYQTQDELLAVAREYVDRGLPISVIVVDYFHWEKMGEWGFDPACWPDPAAMVSELRDLGIELMVSVWPTVNAACSDFERMENENLLVQTERGVSAVTHFLDTYQDDRVYLHHLDPTNPDARTFHYEKIRDNYRKHGIRVFWLDACEPELDPFHFDNIRYHAGPGEAVSSLFPRGHQQAYFDGLTEDGEESIITLGRSAWAGSQRFGAALWSGDIDSTFESLTKQIRAGLNVAMSGLPWWCTDIGGFTGGDIRTPYFQELIVRWFQYGVFCPIFRLHGVRQPETFKSGGPNEVWEFGDRALGIITRLMNLRESLRPYVHEQMEVASASGLPPMRPIFVDYPDDERAWTVEDAFLFGPDILVAPITAEGATERDVYLPVGGEWIEVATGESCAGGSTRRAEAPLDVLPLYVRAASWEAPVGRALAAYAASQT